MDKQKIKLIAILSAIVLLVVLFVFNSSKSYNLRMKHEKGDVVAKIGEEEFTMGDIEKFKKFREENMKFTIEKDPSMKEYYEEKGLLNVSDEEMLETIIETELLIREAERNGLIKDSIKKAKEQVKFQKALVNEENIEFKEGIEVDKDELEKMKIEIKSQMDKAIKENELTEEEYFDKYLIENFTRSIASKMMSDKIIEDVSIEFSKELEGKSDEEIQKFLNVHYNNKIKEIKEQYKVKLNSDGVFTSPEF